MSRRGRKLLPQGKILFSLSCICFPAHFDGPQVRYGAARSGHDLIKSQTLLKNKEDLEIHYEVMKNP